MSATTEQTAQRRSAGILLHPSSLPGAYGIGDLGPAAHAWVDALAQARQTWWQMLPLGPPGTGNSPYQCYSAFAGNPNLISPAALIEDGLLRPGDTVADFAADRVDFAKVTPFKQSLLEQAWAKFQGGAAPALRGPLEAFCAAQADWLDDFALFMALKEAHGETSWADWPEELALRRPAALERARRELADTVGRHQFVQFLFYRQLEHLRAHARARGIKLIGDLPIFVSGESADVWASPDLFLLDECHRPRFVAGVPPDFFSKTGQRWGNPLYDWEAMQRQGFAWWIARLRATLAQVDLVRIDHFRGFAACWEVPASCPTAEEGRWAPAPGVDLFRALCRALGELPLIAEDLGEITPDVEQLRDDFHLPGMRVLQFAFGGAVEQRFLPHCYERNSVVYTGTHDNDTTLGWYASLKEEELAVLRRYVPHVDDDVAWEMMRLAWSSVADYALVPLQDVLGLGNEARMNLPGTAEGNWAVWRFETSQLRSELLARLAELTETYGRQPAPAMNSHQLAASGQPSKVGAAG